ncbi:MAG: NUDIX hydrolase [Elioraea sp.]|nr:NUDIX hydrolase [Elioraea sp.]
MGWTAPRVGVGVVLFRGPSVLLVRRGKPPRAGAWSIPGGKQELGETVVQAAQRELLEETGLAPAGKLVLVDVVDSIERSPDGRVAQHYTLIDFAAHAADGEARAGGDSAEVAWVALADLPQAGIWPPTLAVIAKAAAALGILSER